MGQRHESVDQRWVPFQNALKELSSAVDANGSPLGDVGVAAKFDNRVLLADDGREVIVTNTLVSNWKSGNKRPSFRQLPVISEILFDNGWHLPSLLGLIPNYQEDWIHDAVDTARRIDELKATEEQLQQAVSSAARNAIGQLVAATCATGKWAVAVYPSYEGPGQERMHVADRLDFRRIDGEHALQVHLESDLRDLFSGLNVLDSPGAWPRWKRQPARDPDSGHRKDDGVLRYSLVHSSAPFPPVPSSHYHLLRSVSVVSLSHECWPMDTGAALARMLGFGFASTRALSKRFFGLRDPDMAEEHRTHLHRDLHHHRWHRYVWGHFGTEIANEGFFPADPYAGHVTIWLRPSLDLLEKKRAIEPALRRKMTSAESVAHYAGLDRRLEEQMHALQKRGAEIIDIPVDVVGPKSLSRPPRRTLQWERTFINALQAYTTIVDRGLVPERNRLAILDALDGQTDIDNVLYRWLRDRGLVPATMRN